MKDLSIIIVNFNTREYILKCLESVYNQTKGITFEVIVIDNNSADNSANEIHEKFSKVDLIALKENLGFAMANNLGASKASGKYFLLLNPDTVILNGAIQKLFHFAESNPKNRIYGGRTLYGDYSLNPSSCWKKPTLWSLLCYSIGLASIFRNNWLFDSESYGSWRREYVRNVDIVSGCFLMIQRELWNRLKGFDRQYFMYGEDADLCLRAIKLGASPVITPEATIVHYRGASEHIRADKMIRLLKAKNQLVNSQMGFNEAIFGKAFLSFAVFLRMTITYTLMKLKYHSNNERYKVWHKIWHRRNEWML